MHSRLRTFWNDQNGLTVIEYAIVIAIVSIASVSAWTLLGREAGGGVTPVGGRGSHGQ